MAIPDLSLVSGSSYRAQGTGEPTNGTNTFGLPFVANGMRASEIVAGNVDVDVEALGSSVTSVTEGSPLVSADGTQMNLEVTQVGTDQVRVTVTFRHSLTR